LDQEIDKLDLRDRLKLVRSIKKAIKQPNYTLQDSELASVQRILPWLQPEKAIRCFYDVLGVGKHWIYDDDDAVWCGGLIPFEFISGSGLP